MKGCSIESCDRPHRARGYCSYHYSKNVPKGTPKPPKVNRYCTIPGCSELHKAKGLCRHHYEQLRHPAKHTRTGVPHNDPANAKAVTKWRINNREKRRAHDAIYKNPLKIVILAECKHTTTDKELHHPNYDKPYEVIKLCRKCHKRLHRQTKEAAL